MNLRIHACLLIGLATAPISEAISPILGVLSQPEQEPGSNRTVIVSSYVKWLESAGARVVPVRFGAPQCEVDFLLDRVSGVVLPGGSSGTDPTDGYGKFAYNVFRKAVSRRIPIWGTCQGHQQILRFTCYDADEPNPVGSFPSEGYVLPLAFGSGAASSTLYSSLPQDLRRNLASSNLTINLHHFGVGLATFHNSSALSSAFDLVATSMDTTGAEFLALMQHKTLPIATSQFHIEKNAYEFQEGGYDGDDNLGAAAPHGPEGVRAGQYLASWLAAEAREHPFTWSPAEVDDWIIWNWPVEFSHRSLRTVWEQQYVFPGYGENFSCPLGQKGLVYA